MCAFCQIDDANVNNLILIIRPTELCNNVEHPRLTRLYIDKN